MENARDIALRMMARAAQKKQGRSVARNVLSPRLSNNLQANEKIFAQSVALNNSDCRVASHSWTTRGQGPLLVRQHANSHIAGWNRRRQPLFFL